MNEEISRTTSHLILAELATEPTTHPVAKWLVDDLTDRLHDIKTPFNYIVYNGQKIIEKYNLSSEKTSSHSTNKPEALLTPLGLVGTPEEVKNSVLTWGQTVAGNGLVMANGWGSETLHTLPAHPHKIALPTIQDIGALLRDLHFGLPVVDRTLLTLTCNTSAKANALATSLGLLHEALPAELWENTRRADGLIPLPLELLTATGWRPHKSQQQPLKPGQYKVKLEDVL